MSTKVVGDTAYELIYSNDPPLTDDQAQVLVDEYAKLGLRFEKRMWKGNICIITKAPAAQYETFSDKPSDCWQSIKNRAGYDGCLSSKNNTYQPGWTFFTPGADWREVVAFIDANFSSTPRSGVESQRGVTSSTPCKTPQTVRQDTAASSAKERNFPNWDYRAVQELDGLCRTLPILPLDRAKRFFKEANRATKSDAKVVDRQTGKLFEGMMGFVGASDRKDFSATWDDGNTDTFGHGIMVVQTYDKSIGVTFCLARISPDTFLTYGWIGEEERQAVKRLLLQPCSSSGKKWWEFWK